MQHTGADFGALSIRAAASADCRRQLPTTATGREAQSDQTDERTVGGLDRRSDPGIGAPHAGLGIHSRLAAAVQGSGRLSGTTLAGAAATVGGAALSG